MKFSFKIFIAAAIIVAAIFYLMNVGIMDYNVSPAVLRQELTKGCDQLVNASKCETEPSKISLKQGTGITDLQSLCERYSGCSKGNITCCKIDVCGCSP